jgi:hypothetical protein
MLKLHSCGLLLSIVLTMGALAVEDKRQPDANILYRGTIDQLIQAKVDTYSYPLKTPVPVNLLKDAWQAIGRWSLDFLNSTPDATVKQLIQRIEDLNKLPMAKDDEETFQLHSDAIRFEDGTRTVFVVAANYSRRGNIIIFQKVNSEPFRLAWSIKDAARASQERNINVWDDAVNIEGWGSGPLSGYAYILPNTSNGHLRFYLAASTNPWAGGTYTKQLSVWEWTGQEAVPQFISPYSVSIDSPGSITLSGNLLKVDHKADLKTFSSCGSCTAPAATWNLKITPTGVADLGTEFIQPEFKFIDELLYRTQKREIIRSMASDRVATKLRRALDDYAKDRQSQMPELKLKKEPADYYLGMLMGGLKTSRQGANEIVSIHIDYLGELRFTLSRRNGKFYALDVIIPDWQ